MLSMTQLISSFYEPKSPTAIAQHPKTPPALHSPSPTKRFNPTIFIPAPPKKMVLEFSTQEENIGKVFIKLLDTDQLGHEFESLVTGCRGYGYRGTRVYACCGNEWCLMGDVLYDTDAFLKEGEEAEKDTPTELPTVYRGYNAVSESQECPHHDTIGSVVLIGSDLDIDTNSWKLGPQFKICLSESLIKSGRVVGQITEGLEVAEKVSQLFEDSPRITINYCGAC